MKNTCDFNIKKTSPLTRGMYVTKNGFHFAVDLKSKNQCGLYLWKIADVKEQGYRVSQKDAIKILFSDQIRTGSIYAASISNINIKEYSYCYFSDGILISDTHGRAFLKEVSCEVEEKKVSVSVLLSYIPSNKFSWGKDLFPKTSYADSIIYGAHVKGFTKHSSSKVKSPGTYSGMMEKISYLKLLGITAVECMPMNEFISEEKMNQKDRAKFYSYQEKIPETNEKKPRVNYWGYKKGLYFAPKLSYGSSEDVQTEVKALIKKLHQNGIEMIMQFYFPMDYPAQNILEVLRFWVLEYHVDGFRLIGGNIPKDMIARDGILSDTKLLLDHVEELPDSLLKTASNIGIMKTKFMQDVRKYLKGDEDSVQSFVNLMYQKGKRTNTVNHITDYYGFSLADLVSYDRKHNDLNLENNKDGIDYNYSWNCGVEGPTSKRKVLSLRKKQMKNAFTMLLLAQGTPYIKAGDEFAFSQSGNNNPYCQDNELTWLDWDLYKKNRKQVQFVKELIAYRKAHPILHMDKELRVMDTLGCGYPDVSFHGEETWRPILDHVSRHVGILYCGKYSMVEGKEDAFILILYNMDWNAHDFAFPRLPKGRVWKKTFDTNLATNPIKKEDISVLDAKEEKTKVKGRSIKVYMSEGV